MVESQFALQSTSDRCPYPRPFGDNFAECQTYHGVAFTAFDSQGHRLGTWPTCSHLVRGDHPEQRGRFYPRCDLGTSEDRLRWLAMVTQARLHVVRVLQQEFDGVIQPHFEQLVEAKTRLLLSPAATELRDHLEGLLIAYRDAIRQFLADARPRLEDAAVSVEELMTQAEGGSPAWLENVTLQALQQTWGLPRVEAHAQALIPIGAQPRSRRAEAKAVAVYEDTILRITKQGSPPGLRFDGTVDASNGDVVAQALMASVDGASQFQIDLSGVLFCDLGGMRAIIQAARQVGQRGGKLVLAGVPTHFQKGLALAGWATDASLILVSRTEQ